MKKIKLCISLLFLLATCTLKAQENQFSSVSDWNGLLAEAKLEKKMIFIDAYFEGCYPCKQMETEVFILPEVRQQMKDHFVSVKIDFLKEELGKQLQVKYAVTGFPTFLMLDENGQLITMLAGYQEADKFKHSLTDAVMKSSRGVALKGFSPVLGLTYPGFYTKMLKEYKPFSQEELVAYLKGKDLFSEVNAIPLLIGRSLNEELGDQLVNNYKKFETLYGRRLVWGRVMENLGGRIGKKIQGRDDVKFEAFLADVQPLFAKEDWPYARIDLAEAYYLNQLNDRQAFFTYAVKYPNDDDDKIRYIGSRLARPGTPQEDKVLFAEWVKLMVDENSGYEVLIAGVRIMLELNNKEQARKYAGWGMKKAHLINKSDKYFQSALNG